MNVSVSVRVRGKGEFRVHARVIEQFIGGIVRIPRSKVGPYSVSKDGLQELERGQRGAYAFPGAEKRSCR